MSTCLLYTSTTYPYSDNYAEEAGEYKSARSTFIMGMGGVIVGIAGFFATLVTLVLLSGHEDGADGKIRLFPIDRIYTCLLYTSSTLIHGLPHPPFWMHPI